MTSGRLSIIVASAGGGTGDPWAGGVAGACRGAGLALCGRAGRPDVPRGAGVSTAHGRPAEAGARRARAAKSPSGVRGRAWTRVGRCAWTGAFEDVLLPRFSQGASGVTETHVGPAPGLRPNALGNRSPEPRAGTLARKERGRETLAAASRPRASVRGAESRRRLQDAHRTPEGPPKRSRDFQTGNLRSCDTSPHVGGALASEKLDIDTTRVSFLPASC